MICFVADLLADAFDPTRVSSALLQKKHLVPICLLDVLECGARKHRVSSRKLSRKQPRKQ